VPAHGRFARLIELCIAGDMRERSWSVTWIWADVDNIMFSSDVVRYSVVIDTPE
jgi:hypothetical protein